jgi:hypothetical protein
MEDFGYSNKKKKQEDGLGSMKKIALIAASLFSVACFIYVTIQAYNFFYSGNGKNVETIHSPEGQIKIMEEEKNALNNKESEINHAVYDDIFGNKKESLKQSKPKLRAITEPAIPPQIKELVKEKITTKTAEVKTEKTPEIKEKLLINSGDKKEVQQQDLLEKKAVEKKVVKSNKKKVIRVQVAAMTSKKSAEDYWKKLNQTNSRIFAKYDSFIEEVDLGKRGIFYRLQIGDFFNQVDADGFCNNYVTQMHKTRADCIIVE